MCTPPFDNHVARCRFTLQAEHRQLQEERHELHFECVRLRGRCEYLQNHLQRQRAEQQRLQEEHRMLSVERAALVEQRAQQEERQQLQSEREELLWQRTQAEERRHARRLQGGGSDDLDEEAQDAYTQQRLQDDLESLMGRERRRLWATSEVLKRALLQHQAVLQRLQEHLGELEAPGELQSLRDEFDAVRRARADEVGAHLRFQQEIVTTSFFEDFFRRVLPLDMMDVHSAAFPPRVTRGTLQANTKVVVCGSLCGVDDFEEATGRTHDLDFKGESKQVCMVCLDNFRHGEELRVLPCGHRYHLDCIDPWLLDRSPECPVCRRTITTMQA